MLRLVMVFVVCIASGATAQDVCIEPFRPDADSLADSGYEAQGMRDSYRGYFSEVEDYLNCLNQASARIRQDATAAAQDYNRMLDQYPTQSEQGGEPPPTPRVEMSESGTLFLDYEANWLR